jgi:hypothetical protein
MELVYVLLPNNAEWEEITIFLDKQKAIDASIKYPKKRVEIFGDIGNGYIPTYKYIKNGIFSE